MKMRSLFITAAVGVFIGMLASCSKESTNVSKPQFKAGATIKSDTLSGSVKGTMLTGKTYYFASAVTINQGDTLVMQSGVKLLSLDPSAMLIVNGVFISLGTKDQPNWITGVDAYKNPATYKQTSYQDPNTDKGLCLTCLNGVGKLWGGIQCGTTCSLLNIKWTHLDFAGGTVDSGSPLVASGLYKAGDALFVTQFKNPNGIYILEDSWVYGSTTDAARVNGGKIHFMRNTIEKVAYNDGDALNVKGGTTGDMAYNLIIGSAKGGTKASNKGIAVGAPQTNINMYNNTYVNGGWRSVDPDRGANVNYEQGAKGWAVNNIMVNCRTGIRFLENPVADTTGTDSGYGNNLSYGDSVSVTGQFLPSSHLAKYNATDIPTPGSYYAFTKQAYWVLVGGSAQAEPGATTTNGYDGSSLVGKNNPMFVNYSLPFSPSATNGPDLRSITWADGFDFHLQASSPAIGKGNTTLSPINATSSLTNPYLAATVTPPNKDLGAYPTDGSGNQH